MIQSHFSTAFSSLPLVAILRGITPVEVVSIGLALAEAGFTLIEVPLNSPDAFQSIRMLRQSLPASVVVGAGTVLEADDVAQVRQAGGALIVSPNMDVTVIEATKAQGAISLPGVATASECFAAIKAGADALKFFPCELIPPQGIKAMKAVLPKHIPVLAVGGITPDTMRPYWQAGVAGFGLGSALYKAGDTAQDVAKTAAAFVSAFKQL